MVKIFVLLMLSTTKQGQGILLPPRHRQPSLPRLSLTAASSRLAYVAAACGTCLRPPWCIQVQRPRRATLLHVTEVCVGGGSRSGGPTCRCEGGPDDAPVTRAFRQAVAYCVRLRLLRCFRYCCRAARGKVGSHCRAGSLWYWYVKTASGLLFPARQSGPCNL